MIFQSLLLLAVATVGTVKSVNPCHSNCEPYMCHGPLAAQCESCAGNKRLVLGACVCQVGWFDKPGNPCSVFSFDCVEGTMDPAFNVYCTRCEHNTNGPFAGVCQEKDWTYQETKDRRTMNSTEISQQNQFYIMARCMDMKPLGSDGLQCATCRKNWYLKTGSSICFNCPLAGCYNCETNTGICLSGCGDGLYYNSTGPSCDHCFYSCRRCENQQYNKCTECKRGFYWQKNSYDGFGICKPCHKDCVTCFGPGSRDCGILFDRLYWIDHGLTTNRTQMCGPNCGVCDSMGGCLRCIPRSSNNAQEYIYDEATRTCEFKEYNEIIYNCLEVIRKIDGSY